LVTLSGSTVPGEWLLDRQAGAAQYRLTLTRHDTLVDARRVVSITATDLPGFDPASFDRPETPVRFAWVREAGTFKFRGTVAAGRASGQFWFQSNAAFETALRDRIASWWDPGLLFDLAVAGTGLQAVASREPRAQEGLPPRGPQPEDPALDAHWKLRYLRALKESGYALTRDEATRLLDRGVAPDLLRQMKLSGFDALSVSDMLRLQTHGVTQQDVRLFELRRGPNLTVDEIVRLKTNGVD
jgi:hypothetical protein